MSKPNYWDKLSGTDEAAATYMETYGEGVGSPLRHLIGKYLKSGEWVLDAGCGPGWNFNHFLEHGPSVKYRGEDYSERFVRVANQRVKPMRIFSIGDVRKLRHLDGSFDVVIMQDVLEHTNGYEKPVREALRVARRLAIFTFWHLMDKEEDNPVNDDGDDGWGAWYSKPKWEKYLDSLNLKWTHERLPRKDAFHDLYAIEVEHG